MNTQGSSAAKLIKKRYSGLCRSVHLRLMVQVKKPFILSFDFRGGLGYIATDLICITDLQSVLFLNSYVVCFILQR